MACWDLRPNYGVWLLSVVDLNSWWEALSTFQTYPALAHTRLLPSWHSRCRPFRDACVLHFHTKTGVQCWCFLIGRKAYWGLPTDKKRLHPRHPLLESFSSTHRLVVVRKLLADAEQALEHESFLSESTLRFFVWFSPDICIPGTIICSFGRDHKKYYSRHTFGRKTAEPCPDRLNRCLHQNNDI